MTTATQSGFDFNERYMRVLTTILKNDPQFNEISRMRGDIDIEGKQIEVEHWNKTSTVRIDANKKNQHIHLLFLQGVFNITSILCKEDKQQCWPPIHEEIESLQDGETVIRESGEAILHKGIIVRTIIAPVTIEIVAIKGSMMLLIR